MAATLASKLVRAAILLRLDVLSEATSGFSPSPSAVTVQVDVNAHGQLMRLEPSTSHIGLKDIHEHGGESNAAGKDWVVCKHFVRTEVSHQDCGFENCPLECGNCTEDEQCEQGFYCSRTLKKCINAEAMECKEPTAHCRPDGSSCSEVFKPDAWVVYPKHCLVDSTNGVQGGLTLIMMEGVDVSSVAGSSQVEKAMQRALKQMAEVAYDARWIAVSMSQSERDVELRQLYVRFRFPVPGPVRRPATKDVLLQTLQHRNAQELQQLLALQLKREGQTQLGHHLQVGNYEVMGQLVQAVTNSTTSVEASLGSSTAAPSGTTAHQVAHDAASGGGEGGGSSGGQGGGDQLATIVTTTEYAEEVQSDAAAAAAEESPSSTSTTHPFAAAEEFFSDFSWWKITLLVLLGLAVLGGIGFGIRKYMNTEEDQGRLDLIEG